MGDRGAATTQRQPGPRYGISLVKVATHDVHLAGERAQVVQRRAVDEVARAQDVRDLNKMALAAGGSGPVSGSAASRGDADADLNRRAARGRRVGGMAAAGKPSAPCREQAAP